MNNDCTCVGGTLQIKLTMNIIITENKLHDVIFKWLDKRLGDLTIVKHPKYHSSTFYIKNDVVMIKELNKHPNYNMIVNYELIFSVIMRVFSLDRNQTSSILTKWIEDRLKIKVKGDVQPLYFWEDGLVG